MFLSIIALIVDLKLLSNNNISNRDELIKISIKPFQKKNDIIHFLLNFCGKFSEDDVDLSWQKIGKFDS